MHRIVDEQGWGSAHLTRRHSAFYVPADTSTYAGPVDVEPCYVEPKVGGIPPQVVIGECPLVAEEQLVHVPEPVLEGDRLGGSGRGQGVRVDPGQREMPEGGGCARASSSGRLLAVL
jgi:hypothetical protein